MPQFRSRKDGSHYPLKGGKRIYPKNNNEDLWAVVPKDYRSIKDGKKYVLAHDNSGTVLVPLDSEEARKTWGKYLNKKTKWKKRLNLPYRIEYELKEGNEFMGKHGIMVLQDQKEGASIVDKPEKLNTFSVIKREYKTKPHTGQTYKPLLKSVPKDEAIAFMEKYMQNHESG